MSSPYINRFLSADTIVPNYANPQSLNRYSYVNDNPVRFADPTGHMMSEGQDGGLGVEGYKYVIKKKFKWHLKGDWSQEEVKTIYQTGNDILTYVNGLTGGKGLDWMHSAFGNTTIKHVDFSDGHSDAWPPLLGGSLGSRIRLNEKWLNDAWGAQVVFAHELGHVWDIHSGFAGSYNLNLDMGGSGVCLFCTVGNKVPQWRPEYHDSYGNSGRNEYFAEAFSATIYNRGSAPDNVAFWIDSKISDSLKVYPWRRP